MRAASLGISGTHARFSFMAILPAGARASPLVMILAVVLLILCLLALAWYFQRTSSTPASPPMHAGLALTANPLS